MAPPPVLFAWKIPWMEEPGRLQSMGSLRVRHNWATSLSLSCIGEGNGNPLQCSCLENPRDRGAWCAVVYGVAQSQTWLKWLSRGGDHWSREEGPEKRVKWEWGDWFLWCPLSVLSWGEMLSCVVTLLAQKLVSGSVFWKCFQKMSESVIK